MKVEIKDRKLVEQTLTRKIELTVEVNEKRVPMVVTTEEDYEHGVITEMTSSSVDVDQWNSLENEERMAIKSFIEDNYS